MYCFPATDYDHIPAQFANRTLKYTGYLADKANVTAETFISVFSLCPQLLRSNFSDLDSNIRLNNTLRQKPFEILNRSKNR